MSDPATPVVIIPTEPAPVPVNVEPSRDAADPTLEVPAQIELDRREQAAGLYERSESLDDKERLTGNTPIWPHEALKVPKNAPRPEAEGRSC